MENLTELITVRFSAFLGVHLICFDFISIGNKSVNKIQSSKRDRSAFRFGDMNGRKRIQAETNWADIRRSDVVAGMTIEINV